MFSTDATAERQSLVGIEREGEHSYHQAILSLGWMAREREGMILEVLAIPVGNL